VAVVRPGANLLQFRLCNGFVHARDWRVFQRWPAGELVSAVAPLRFLPENHVRIVKMDLVVREIQDNNVARLRALGIFYLRIAR